MRLTELAQSLLDQLRVGQDLAVQGGVIDLDTTLQGHLLDVAVAERLAQVLGDRLHDESRLVVAALEVGLGALLQLRGDGGQDHGVASEGGGAMRALWSTRGKRRCH